MRRMVAGILVFMLFIGWVGPVAGEDEEDGQNDLVMEVVAADDVAVAEEPVENEPEVTVPAARPTATPRPTNTPRPTATPREPRTEDVIPLPSQSAPRTQPSTPTTSTRQPRGSDFEIRGRIFMLSNGSFEVVGTVVNNGPVPGVVRLTVQAACDRPPRSVEIGDDGSSTGSNIRPEASAVFDITGRMTNPNCTFSDPPSISPTGFSNEQINIQILNAFAR